MIKYLQPDESSILGNRIKEKKKKKHLSQTDLAEAVGKSTAYLSNVERGKTDPPLGLLRKIALALECPVANFFVGPDDLSYKNGSESVINLPNRVVKKNQRKHFTDPSSHSTTWELLSPDTRRKMEFLLVRYEAGAQMLEPSAHEGEECGLVLSGKLKVTIEGKEFILEEGDSIYFESSQLHELQNISDGETITVWVITPPSF